MLEKREADVIIIGGGIMGCATAYRLAKRGLDVLVLEKKEIGNGGSCRNAGGVRQSARDPKELPLAMYAVQNIWPQLSEELHKAAAGGGDDQRRCCQRTVSLYVEGSRSSQLVSL